MIAGKQPKLPKLPKLQCLSGKRQLVARPDLDSGESFFKFRQLLELLRPDSQPSAPRPRSTDCRTNQMAFPRPCVVTVPLCCARQTALTQPRAEIKLAIEGSQPSMILLPCAHPFTSHSWVAESWHPLCSLRDAKVLIPSAAKE